MPGWLKWGFWVCPLSYGEIGLAVNEFLSPIWNKKMSTDITIGQQILQIRGLDFDGYYFWISLGALFGFELLFNIVFIMALSYLKVLVLLFQWKRYLKYTEVKKQNSRIRRIKQLKSFITAVTEPYEGKMVLPFEPLTITFQDLHYYVEPPPEMRGHSFTGKRLQLLHDITGAFRPGVLTALMGVSGSGKQLFLTFLLEGKPVALLKERLRLVDILKVKRPLLGFQVTVSRLMYTLPKSQSKNQSYFLLGSVFILELIQKLNMDALVGIPGVSGLSSEQRKRLTIAVDVVANPSIIFMDEPTTGLDARSATIVMRPVKNIVETGRTIVCTIHQPSIDIFEAFYELILLKNGGRMIYCGPLGRNSSRVIEYLQSISRLPKIRDNYNPATWMLEVTSSSMEAELGVDFGEIYSISSLYKSNKDLVKTISKPPFGSKELYFPTRFP